jgi:CheY-like chemotaxis protein
VTLLQSYKSVLVVDDNPIDRMITAKILEKMRAFAHIHTFASARAALDYLAFMAEPGQHPELILLDLDMPLMNGFQFLEQCQSRQLLTQLTTKVIFLTSSMNESDQQRAASFSVKGYLNKPLTMERLKTLLEPGQASGLDLE